MTLVPVLVLRWVPPVTSAFMLRERLAGRVALEQRWVPWREISPQLPLAAVAAEDQRFPEHRGFDLAAAARAVEESLEGERLRGASTISQQVAKNLFLWPGRSFLRKGLEAYFTLLLEALWPKRRILEVYLNVSQFADGVYGVGAASRRFFGKRASQLDAGEAALLAAVLPSPRRLRVERPSAYVRKRQAWILRQMRALGGTAYLRRL